MLNESGKVGDILQANIKLCEAVDSQLVPPTTGNVQIAFWWYHPDSAGAVIGKEILDMGKYEEGMKWSDLANKCQNGVDCGSFIASHTQALPGQICAQLVENGSTSNISPGPPGCIVVGNECSFESSNYAIEFGTHQNSEVNGLSKNITVNVQCGFDTDVKFSLETADSTVYEGKDGKLEAIFYLDDKKLSSTPINLTERMGNNSHVLKTVLSSTGFITGVFSKSFVIIANYD
jgi:hypothetical protein